MGYIAHHAIVVTGCSVIKAYNKAKEIWATGPETDRTPGPSAIVGPVMNGYCSFFIPPDGSKEGWSMSAQGDRCRSEFMKWCRENNIDAVEVRFGGDTPDAAELVELAPGELTEENGKFAR